MIKGNAGVFLVVDTNDAVAKTRGVNGLIPARANDLNQFTATLVEKQDLARMTGFNIFASQGNMREALIVESRAVVNRTIDQDILAEMANATNNTGAAQTATLALVAQVRALLGNNKVPIEELENMFFVVSPRFESYLLQTPEYSNGFFVDVKPLIGPVRRMWRWAGFNWIMSQSLTGLGTATELCYAYHRKAVGHAVDTGGVEAIAGYDEEQDYSFSRTKIFAGTKILQQGGIIQVSHIGT